MKHEIKFVKGHNCRDFECINDSEGCAPGKGGYHGFGSMKIMFYAKGEKGAIQFTLATGIYPFVVEKQHAFPIEDNYQKGEMMPMDLGYHALEPQHEEDKPFTDHCEVLGGKPCYFDCIGLQSTDEIMYEALAALANAGIEGLWSFLDGYYAAMFDGAEYPDIPQYEKPQRLSVDTD